MKKLFQLIELIDGEFVKLQQQDYKEILKITLESGNKLFKDRQFPMGSPIFSFKRPTVTKTRQIEIQYFVCIYRKITDILFIFFFFHSNFRITQF